MPQHPVMIMFLNITKGDKMKTTIGFILSISAICSLLGLGFYKFFWLTDMTNHRFLYSYWYYYVPCLIIFVIGYSIMLTSKHNKGE